MGRSVWLNCAYSECEGAKEERAQARDAACKSHKNKVLKFGVWRTMVKRLQVAEPNTRIVTDDASFSPLVLTQAFGLGRLRLIKSR